MSAFRRCRKSLTPALLAIAAACLAQNVAPSANQTPPAAPGVIGNLTPGEKAQFDSAGKDFAAEKYPPALAIYKSLLAAHPADPTLSKFAAESAINTGDLSYALGLLQPIEQSNPNDWQAVALLARARAESGDKTHRDAEMQRLAVLSERRRSRTRATVPHRKSAGGRQSRAHLALASALGAVQRV